jgi:hypothetical protein
MTCGIPLPAEYLAKVLTKNQEMKKLKGVIMKIYNLF